MRRDFNAIARNFDGRPFEEPVYKCGKDGVRLLNERGEPILQELQPVRVKKYLFELLGGRLRGEENLTGVQLLARYQVAAKISQAGDGPTEITPEDLRTITDVLEKGASPLIYGLVREILGDESAAA